MPVYVGHGRPRKYCGNCSLYQAHPQTLALRQALNARDVWMVTLFSRGKTMQEIGDEYGISRERVRQLLEKRGLIGKDGGRFKSQTVSMIEKGIQSLEKKKAKFLRVWGVTPDEFARLNENKKSTDPSSKARCFVYQRRNAKCRKIGWEITFQEWCNVWEKSGKWEQRGRAGDKYVMCRKMDTGPYSVENVQILTMRQNTTDYQASLKIRGVMHTDGHKRLPENSKLIQEVSP